MTSLVTFSPSVNLAGSSFFRLGHAAYVPGEENRARVKRCLFGPRSADEAFSAQQAAIAELKKLTQHDSAQWNFDFQNEKPQNGRYLWTPYSRATEAQSKPQKTDCTTSTTSSMRQAQITEFWRTNKKSAQSHGGKISSRDTLRLRNTTGSHVIS